MGGGVTGAAKKTPPTGRASPRSRCLVLGTPQMRVRHPISAPRFPWAAREESALATSGQSCNLLVHGLFPDIVFRFIHGVCSKVTTGRSLSLLCDSYAR